MLVYELDKFSAHVFLFNVSLKQNEKLDKKIKS